LAFAAPVGTVQGFDANVYIADCQIVNRIIKM
jgi:hypothetical protein